MKALIDAEFWKPVKGYEGLYEVSSFGRIRSVERNEILRGRHPRPYTRKRKGSLISPRNGPYLNVNLCKKGSKRNYLVHRLVAEAFIDNPKGLPEVNHINEDKHDNRYSNLEWCSSSENSKHSSYKTTGSRNGCSKLNEDQVTIIGYLLRNTDMTLKEIGDQFNVSSHAIFRIKTGDNWSWLTGFGKEDKHNVSS